MAEFFPSGVLPVLFILGLVAFAVFAASSAEKKERIEREQQFASLSDDAKSLYGHLVRLRNQWTEGSEMAADYIMHGVAIHAVVATESRLTRSGYRYWPVVTANLQWADGSKIDLVEIDFDPLQLAVFCDDEINQRRSSPLQAAA